MVQLTPQEVQNIESNVCRKCLTERTCTLIGKGKVCGQVERYYATFLGHQPAPDCKEADHLSTEVPYSACVDPDLQKVLDVRRDQEMVALDKSLATLQAQIDRDIPEGLPDLSSTCGQATSYPCGGCCREHECNETHPDSAEIDHSDPIYQH